MIERLYEDYVQDMVESINEIEDFVDGMTFDNFKKDRKTINATIRSFEVLGEAGKKIAKQTREQYPDIPWRQITGMRDKLIHEYFGVDLEIVWETIKQDLPKLKPLVERLKKELDK